VAGRPDTAGKAAAIDKSGISEKNLQKMAEDLPLDHSALILICLRVRGNLRLLTDLTNYYRHLSQL
jgi:hypothetical protein